MAKASLKTAGKKRVVKTVKSVEAKITKTKGVSPKATKPIEVVTPAPSFDIQTLMTKFNWSEKRNILTSLVKNRPPKIVYVAAILIGASLLFSYKKSWFVAAMVNNKPLNNMELLSRMNQQYRSQVLNQMINEKVILDEAAKKGISVQDKDINDKIKQIETSVGGAATLDGLLAQQGQTRTGLKDQIKFQLIVEKLYGGEATVSADEVTKYIEENKDSLQATDAAGQTQEATDALKQQALTKIFQEKFQALKAAAKIQIF